MGQQRRFRPGRWVTDYSHRRLQGFSIRDAATLASGRRCGREFVWDVPFWLYGRRIATVRVPGADPYGAERFAARFLFANIYPRLTCESGESLPRDGRGIILPVRAER
jgi:hypothetical protein